MSDLFVADRFKMMRLVDIGLCRWGPECVAIDEFGLARTKGASPSRGVMRAGRDRPHSRELFLRVAATVVLLVENVMDY